MPEKTVVEQLAAATTTVADLTAKLTAESGKVTALEASVKALTAERDTFKATAEKATADLTAEQGKHGVTAKALEDSTAKVKNLEAKLADPSFKAADAGGAPVVPQGTKPASEGEPMTLAKLEAAYMAETDPVKLEALRKQIFEAQAK
jgi:hypothetical protein